MLLFRSFLDDDGGATSIEYAVIAGIMAVALIAGAAVFTDKVAIVFNIITSAMEAATG